MMDEQRLKDAENSIGLIDCPDCEQGRVSREGTFEDGQEYERCETCDGSGMVSRFPDGHALIAEVRRLQQENAVLCNGGELQRCVVNAAYEDKCKAEQQRDAALAKRDAAERNEREYRAACEMSICALRDSRERWEQRAVLAEAERDAARAASQNAHECLFETEQSLSEARRVLREVEYVNTNTDPCGTLLMCPLCDALPGLGHQSDCDLADVLAQEEK